MNDPEIKELDIRLVAEIVADRNSGWACVVVDGSASILGTGNPVKISGMIDNHRFEATMLPVGGGAHMIPVKAAVRKAISKGIGDTVAVEIDTRRP